MELKIISGGQTGTDRAALDWAIDNGISHGGWCPVGRLAEDGPIGIEYLLQEMPDGGGYRRRTKANVRDSDATLIVSLASELAGGSKETALFARRLDKPCLHVHPGMDWQMALTAWPQTTEIRLLNVAGPRGSREPPVGAFVCEVLNFILKTRNEHELAKEMALGYKRILVQVEESTEYREEVTVTESDVGLFRVVETSDIPIDDYFFLFGDEFFADQLPDGSHRFREWADRESFVHVLWSFGLIVGGPDLGDLKKEKYLRWEHVRETFAPYPFREAIMRSGGMWELDPGFGMTILTAHFPASYEDGILGNLENLAPCLAKERILRIRSGPFEWPEGW